MANKGDRRPPEQLPGHDPDWRDPRNMQVYAEPLLDPDDLLLLQANADRLRPVTHREAAAAFSLMMGLADDRLFSEADNLSFCDFAERPVARAYQAAAKVLDAYYFDKRLEVGPAYLAAARIVAQCVDVDLLLRDIRQKQREESALASGKARRPSPGACNVVPDILAHWRELRIGGKPFEGSRLDAAAKRFNRDRSTLSETTYNAIFHLEKKYGCYCNYLAMPPEKAIRRCYYVDEEKGKRSAVFFWGRASPKSQPVCFEDGRNQRTDHPQPAIAPAVKLPDETFLGAWRLEALEFWGGWGDATKLPQGLADGYLQPNTKAAYNGARDYGSDPILIWHPQMPADWRQIIDALPNSTRKTKLKDKDAEIERLIADKSQSVINDYFRGGHDWPLEVDPPIPFDPPTRSSAHRLDYGPVRKVNNKLRPRDYERDYTVPDAPQSYWNLLPKQRRSQIVFSAAANRDYARPMARRAMIEFAPYQYVNRKAGEALGLICLAES